MNGVAESVGVFVTVAVVVAVKVNVIVAVKINGVGLEVGERDVSVRSGVVVSDPVGVAVAGGGLIITATHPRQ